MAVRGATYERQDRDFYPTPAWVTRALMRHFRFPRVVWEPACGNGQMAQVLAEHGATVMRSDIHPIGDPDAKELDFLTEPCPWPVNADIVTNSPYGRQGKLAEAFIRRAFEYAKPRGTKVAMLLAVDFDSAKTRAWAFNDCPAFAGQIVLTDRIVWFESADGKKESPSANHAWFVWDFSTAQIPRKYYAGK